MLVDTTRDIVNPVVFGLYDLPFRPDMHIFRA